MNKIYLFEDFFLKTKSATYVCIGSSEFVYSLIPKENILKKYKKEICYISVHENNIFVGVYGKRESSKFRSEIRKRGGSFELLKKRPDGICIKYYTTVR